jgi:outer membrane lipoprotein-sorting protein
MAGLIVPLWFCSACAVSNRTAPQPPAAKPPVLAATKPDLVSRYNALAASINSLNATVTLQLTGGSADSGVIEQYHEVKGFILASRPANIRVIGQAPIVGKNIFDMVSDGSRFEIFIPSKNQFLIGPVNLERKASKPVENLRPQHVLDALFWSAIPPHFLVLMEESEAPNDAYILTVARPFGPDSQNDWRISQKIWFDRTNLSLCRIQTYGEENQVVADERLSDWQPVGELSYPRQIVLERIADDYQLRITVSKLSLNESIPLDKFRLDQPEGSKLVRLGPEAQESQP